MQKRTNVCGTECPIFREKDWYKKKIIETVSQIKDVWILKTMHNFIVGMTKEARQVVKISKVAGKWGRLLKKDSNGRWQWIYLKKVKEI